MGLKKFLTVFCAIVVCRAYAEQPKLLIATLEYPPFVYSENNGVKGPLADKIRAVFSQLGITVVIRIYPISRGLLMVQTGEVDAFFSLKKTPEREKKLLFTNEPLIKQPFVFFARKDSDIKWNGNIQDIKDYTIGIVSNTSYGSVFDGYVKQRALRNLEEAQSFEKNVSKLIAGRVDLIINSYDVGLELIKKLHAEDNIIALLPPVEIVHSYLAFTRAKDYSKLVGEYDAVLSRENKE
jgi:polar amino acid transport system substrate-binding protein